jgi:hypothetical protein
MRDIEARSRKRWPMRENRSHNTSLAGETCILQPGCGTILRFGRIQGVARSHPRRSATKSRILSTTKKGHIRFARDNIRKEAKNSVAKHTVLSGPELVIVHARLDRRHLRPVGPILGRERTTSPTLPHLHVCAFDRLDDSLTSCPCFHAYERNSDAICRSKTQPGGSVQVE